MVQHIIDSFVFELMDDALRYKVKALLESCKGPIEKGIEVVERYASMRVLIYACIKVCIKVCVHFSTV